MILCNVDLMQLWDSGGPLWFLAGAIVMSIPKAFELIRGWRKENNEYKADKRKDFLNRLTTMEEIITNQQSRYMVLHEQLMKEREEAQSENLDLKKKIHELESRINFLEEQLKQKIISEEGGGGI